MSSGFSGHSGNNFSSGRAIESHNSGSNFSQQGSHNFSQQGSHNFSQQGSHTFSQQGSHNPSGHDQGNFSRGDAWNHGWADHRGWDNYHDNWWHDHGHGWVGWWGVDFGWPGYGIGIGWWPGYYGYYGSYPVAYYADVYSDYGYAPTAYTAAYPPSDTGDAPPPPQTGSDPMEFYPQALAAFQQGDFRNATRLAGHASIDDPKNPDIHALLMSGLFAMAEYRGAAIEGHAVASLGKVPDWAKLYSFYGKVEPYTEQLRALEKFVREHPSAPEARFLLGLQYLMADHKDAAKTELLQALKLAPKDRLAAQLLTQAGGTVPEDIAKQLAQPAPKPPAPQAPKSP
jgi:tetratricopeptide (TPR) repeat protein